MKILHRIRLLPRHTQAHVAFIASFILSVVIALLWIPTLPARFEETRNSVTEVSSGVERKSNVDTVINEISSSATQIQQIFKETTSTAKENLTEQTEQGYEILIYESELASSSVLDTNSQTPTANN